MYIAMFFRPIRQIADRFNTLQLGVVSTERILKLLDSDEHISDSGELKPTTLKGDVKFDNVWFAYNEEEYVLKGISFEVKSGQTVALVGATGAGKTSIINLLTRFYEINKGTISIDGHDLKAYDLSELRKHIGLVLQDVFLFSGTIADNISLGNKSITEAQMWEAAELVGARKFIERLPGGREPAGTARAFEAFKAAGTIDIPADALARMQATFTGVAIGEDETVRTIVSTLDETGELIDPHTAVAVAALKHVELDGPTVVLSTAHAAKFPEDVARASGLEPALPRGVASLADRSERFERIAGDAAAIKAYVRDFAEAAPVDA